MRNRKLVTLLLCVTVFALSPSGVHAQITTQNIPVAIKFDEFGDIYWSDLIARLDNFAVELQNNPTARGHMIYYRSRRDLPGLSSRNAGIARNYMLNSRGVDSAQLTVVDGGARDCIGGELWVVPAGAAAPTPSNTYNYSFIDTDTAYKFDAAYYPLDSDVVSDSGSLGVGGNLRGFAAKLKEQRGARGYIIVYAQHHVERLEEEGANGKVKIRTRVTTDAPGTARRILVSEKAELVKRYGISPSRVVTIDGGYRKGRNIELWIVPRGERPPVPTPNVYPPRRRARH